MKHHKTGGVGMRHVGETGEIQKAKAATESVSITDGEVRPVSLCTDFKHVCGLKDLVFYD